MSWFPSSGAQSEEDGRGCWLNHRHLRHFISPTLFSQAWGSVCVGQENSLTSSLVPSFPPFLPQTTHFYKNPVIFPPSPSHFLSPSSCFFLFLHLFFLHVSFFLSIPHSAIPLIFFFFVTAKEEKMSSQRAGRGEDGENRRESRGESFVRLRKRETDAAPAETQRTALVLPVRVMDRPGKSSPCENKTPKRRKDPHRTGQLLKENQSILVFSSSRGAKLSSLQTCTVDFSALTICDYLAPSLPPSSRSPLPPLSEAQFGTFSV